MTKQIKRVVRKLSIKNGDIIALKRGTWLATKEKIDMLGEYLAKSSRAHCLIIVVDELDDLESLNEKIMNRYGWYKIRSKN